MGSVYLCYVYNNPIILTEESAEIKRISGIHEGSRNNDHVTGFSAIYLTLKFFPRGLDKFFKNLKMFRISYCQLKEIHQSDLKPFPNLVYLFLFCNEIEVIEAGLFDFNPNLEVVGFREPKIKHIDPNVFDNLTKLRWFWFREVPCIDKNIDDSKDQVQEAIKVVKSKCSDFEFLSRDNQIENLETKSNLSITIQNF